MRQLKLELGVVRTKLLLLGVVVVVVGLYSIHLGNLPSYGLASGEVASLHTSSSLTAAIDHPLFLPLNALRWAARQILPGHATLALRAPSVLFGLTAIAALLYIVRRWYGPRTLLFGLIVFASSAWFLHVARLGTNDIAYLSLLPILLASQLLLYEYPENRWVFYGWTVVMALLLYVPGAIWFVALSIWWQRSDIATAWRKLGLFARPLLLTVTALLLAPFIYGALQQASLESFALTWLGLPSSLPSPLDPLKNLAAALLFGFVRTPFDPARWLGHLPLLDAFLTVSFLGGCLFYLSHLKAERTRILLSYGALALVLCAFGGAPSRNVLVPLVYLIALGGIAFILHQWLKRFPNNILARRLGITLIYVALVLSCAYNLRHYFVAWPHNSDTKATFNVAPPKR